MANSATAFDPKLAVKYGLFVNAAYQMHNADPNGVNPKPIGIPSGYQFLAWVQMRDFIFASSAWAFYGFIVQSTANPHEFVLAIRGTSSPEEWLDDLTSAVLTPWSGAGLVGYGFNRIYETLQVVEPSPAQSLAVSVHEESAVPGSFAEQVAALLQRHAPTPPPGATGAQLVAAPEKSLIVAGHSLGSALATLYALKNAAQREQTSANAFPKVTDLYTFASPRVGDGSFAAAFDRLPISSWRIVNEMDIVPKLPPPILFTHVEPDYVVNSSNLTKWTPGCWHALTTYLHLLDPAQPLDPTCVASATLAAGAPVSGLLAEGIAQPISTAPTKDVVVSIPAGQTTVINITINIGRDEKINGRNS